MAATKGVPVMRMFFPTAMEECPYSTLDDGVTVTHTLKNQINVMPFKVSMMVTVPADDGSPVFLTHKEASYDNTAGANTIALVFSTVTGGDLTGAEVKVFIEQNAQASGGISA